MMALRCILLFLNFLNVLFHSLGAYLLISMYPRCKQKIQQIYLFNLSISECLTNVLEICRSIPDLIEFEEDELTRINEIRQYILIVSFTGVSIVYYFDMIYLTLDRLLDVHLNMKYPVYWNETKTRYLLISTWAIGLFTSVSVSICYKYLDFKWRDAFFKYFYPTIEFTFIVLALITYGFIFHKYRQTRLRVPGCMSVYKVTSTLHIFRKSRFYIPVLLIITFLLLMIAPDITYLIVGIVYKSESETLLTCCWISYAISNLADAYIYIFVQYEVRKEFYMMLHCCRSENRKKSKIKAEFHCPRKQRSIKKNRLITFGITEPKSSTETFCSDTVWCNQQQNMSNGIAVIFTSNASLSNEPTINLSDALTNSIPSSSKEQVVKFAAESADSCFNKICNVTIVKEANSTIQL